jgi:hypothetical protein
MGLNECVQQPCPSVKSMIRKINETNHFSDDRLSLEIRGFPLEVFSVIIMKLKKTYGFHMPAY